MTVKELIDRLQVYGDYHANDEVVIEISRRWTPTFDVDKSKETHCYYLEIDHVGDSHVRESTSTFRTVINLCHSSTDDERFLTQGKEENKKCTTEYEANKPNYEKTIK